MKALQSARSCLKIGARRLVFAGCFTHHCKTLLSSQQPASLTHPDGGLVAAHTVDGQPCGQVQQALEDLLVQLQVGQLAFALQCAQVDLVWGQVLGKSARDKRRIGGLSQGNIYLE